MLIVHFIVFFAAIFLGARLGGIGIGFAGGLGVLVLAVIGVHPGEIPLDVVSIMMSVITAIAAMQVAGGMDYLVYLAGKALRKHPKGLNFLAPLITYLMTFMAGTGNTAFATLPVITEVAKESNIPPRRPLSLAVVTSQAAITASPISAAVVFMSTMLEDGGTGIDYLDILAISIPSTFLSFICTAAIMTVWDRMRGTDKLDRLPEYQRRLAAGTVSMPSPEDERKIDPAAKRSVWIFLVGLIAVMVYATIISDKVGLISDPVMGRDDAIIAIMLSIATVILVSCKAAPAAVLESSSFKSGMNAAICVMGVAWLGATLVTAHEDELVSSAGKLLGAHPWTLAVILVLASSLLYSQAATSRALMPTALAIGVAPAAMVAAFPATSALFILPTYPTLVAAVGMDDTGSTQIGKYVFNHPFLVPGLMNIAIAVAIGFGLQAVII